MIFASVLALVAIIAGAVASLTGFGIGSLLTPLLALKTGIGVAVAAIAIVHVIGTSLRFFLLRGSVNKRVLLSFGLASAAGGLIGALLHNTFNNSLLGIIFGCLLIIAGVSEITGLAGKIQIKGPLSWFSGGLSGLFGGLVGNQGGIRSAALTGFDLRKDEFVATATGIALMVDVARIPVYLAVQGRELIPIWNLIAIATIWVIAGTLFGKRVLQRLSQQAFTRTVGVVLIGVGALVIILALQPPVI
ncbi:MAG: sulfite exporter TauE/SafE family protein [Dehalogenimonas sp.]